MRAQRTGTKPNTSAEGSRSFPALPELVGPTWQGVTNRVAELCQIARMPNVLQRALSAFRSRVAYTGGADFWNTPPSLLHRKGMSVTSETALQVSTAYACIRAIASTMAYLPKGIHEQTEEGKQIKPQHPVHELISSAPNSYETAFQFWSRMYTASLCYGRGVALIDRDSFTGYPKSMHVVHPKNMRTLDMDGAMLVEIDGKTYAWEDVLIVSELQGRSPIDLHRDNLNLTKDVEAYGSDFFEGGHLLGVLSADGPLTNDQMRDLQRAWNSTEKRGTKILPQGMKYQAISLPPEQTSFLSTRRYQDETICTIFGVPPNVVGVSTKETKANSEEQGRNFVRMTLLPRAVQLEQEIARKLLPAIERPGMACSVDLRELQRGDTAARSQYLSTLLRDGVISRNEARRAEGFNQRNEPGADSLLVQVNNIALDQVDNYSAKISASNALD